MQEVLWQFKTANFTIRLSCEFEQYPDLSWDDTGEVAAKIESGFWGNYRFKVAVLFRGIEVASDYLGNSIYEDPKDFRDHIGRNACGHGSYFSDMVRNVVSDARIYLSDVPEFRAA